MDRQQQIEEDAKEAVEKLSRMVNCFDDSAVAKAFAENMLRQHPTLQQSMMRVIVETIKAWSETKWFDLRNEATVKLSQKIVEEVGEDFFLPFI